MMKRGMPELAKIRHAQKSAEFFAVL